MIDGPAKIPYAVGCIPYAAMNLCFAFKILVPYWHGHDFESPFSLPNPRSP